MNEHRRLKRTEVQELIESVRREMPHEDCRTCDCFLGFVTRLELDCREDVSDITNPLKTQTDQVHGCLGCNPCPPAEAYTEYIRKNLTQLK
jgi:hypothetical protein